MALLARAAGDSQSKRRSSAVAGFVGLVALLFGGCSRAETAASPEQPTELLFDAQGTDHVDLEHRSNGSFALEEATGETIIARLAIGEPPLATPLEVASAVEADVYSFADSTLTGSSQWFPNPTQFGGPRVFRVLDSSSHPDAIQISLPIKPNGQTGWIARNSVELSSIEHQVLVDLANDSVTIWDGDEVLSHSLAVTGTPWTPTPTGVFFMRDVIRPANPDGAYGSHILALSGFSEVLDSFAGGLPAIAIHGTNKPDTIGQERSNGCVRLPNEIIGMLADELPLGTPVTVVESQTVLGFVHQSDRHQDRRIY